MRGEKRIVKARLKRLAAALTLAAVLLVALGPVAEAQTWVSHRVSPGESLWLIARRHGTTVASIRQANGLWGDLIYPGQVLRVPVGSQTVPVSRTDLDWLARLVWAEAEGEPYQGQVAVAAVILNRVRHPSFPNTIRGVIFQPGQFETVQNGRIYRPAPQIALRAAQDAVNGWDPSYGAIFFFNPAKTNNRFLWSRPVTVTIGRHRCPR